MKKVLQRAKAAVKKHDKDIAAKNKKVKATNEVNPDLSNARLYVGQTEPIHPDLQGTSYSLTLQSATRKPGSTRQKVPDSGSTVVGDGPDKLLGNEHLSIKKRGERMGTE